MSPRKIINIQNISQKYLQILNDDYIIFNYSIDNNFVEYLKLSNKKIVICCTQSISKIYSIILSLSITNITIWFDEAHWGVEEWIETLDNDRLIKQLEKEIENNKKQAYEFITCIVKSQVLTDA